jgi:hypothetical protein
MCGRLRVGKENPHVTGLIGDEFLMRHAAGNGVWAWRQLGQGEAQRDCIDERQSWAMFGIAEHAAGIMSDYFFIRQL